MLLIDYDNGQSINRAFYEGEPFKADALLSLYGETDLQQGVFSWTLSREGKVARSGSFPVENIAVGGVATVGQVELVWPEVTETTRFNLGFSLKGNLVPISNHWDFWVFPRRHPPAVTAAADEKCLKLLVKRYPGLMPLAGHPERLQIVSSLTVAGLEHLNSGGDILLLGTDPFPINKGYNSFRSGLGDMPHANIGTVLAKHPIFADLPNEGWADWHFYHVLDGAWAFIVDDAVMGGFSPILEIISPAGHVRKQAAIFERRVGKGRLLASSCVNKMDNPACVALLDGMMQYVTSDKFQPALTMHLEPAILAEYAAELPPKEPDNYVPEPSFDRRSDVLFMWQPYGAGFMLDRKVAHRGRGSLRLQISPEQLKAKPGTSVGAGTAINKFGLGQRLRLAAWCRTDNVSGETDRDFQICAFLNYADGTRETIRLPLPTGTHDWQLVETFCHPVKELNPDQSPSLYISMSGKSGTVWLDDLYLGPAPNKQ